MKFLHIEHDVHKELSSGEASVAGCGIATVISDDSGVGGIGSPYLGQALAIAAAEATWSSADWRGDPIAVPNLPHAGPPMLRLNFETTALASSAAGQEMQDGLPLWTRGRSSRRVSVTSCPWT